MVENILNDILDNAVTNEFTDDIKDAVLEDVVTDVCQHGDPDDPCLLDVQKALGRILTERL